MKLLNTCNINYFLSSEMFAIPKYTFLGCLFTLKLKFLHIGVMNVKNVENYYHEN